MATRVCLFLLLAAVLWPPPPAAAVELAGGQLAHIANTAGLGVRLRAQPSLVAPTLLMLREGDEVRIVGGPTLAERYRWYRVRIGADTGWTVDNWLAPGAAPALLTALTTSAAPTRAAAPLGGAGAVLLGRPPAAAAVAPAATATTGAAATATLAPTATPLPRATPTPVSAAAQPAFASGALVQVVNTDGRGLRLRDGAGTDEAVRIAAVDGDVLAVLAGPVKGDGLDWYRVRLGDTIGWAAANWLAPARTGAAATATSRAATAAAPAATATAVARADALATSNDGPPVAPSGQTQSEPVRAVPGGSDTGSRAARLALGFLGQDYEWGGVQPGAFDCEGLVWYVYRQLGLALPWGTWNQFSVGQRVDRTDLRPGDLVFFRNTYAYGVTHVGLAIGNGQFIHALNEEAGVLVSSLDAPYWRAHYFGARRVVDE